MEGVENCYVFKSRLQEYAQKAGLQTPEYHTLKEGPSHEPIFKSTVVINNTKYDSLPGFFNRKAAEQSAAEVALMEIVKSIPTNANIPAVQETGLCKNLLQEYAQKMNYAIPSYICTKQASGLAPFICTVEIGGIQYIGAAARTKKEAEIKAARTALLAIQGQSESCANGDTKHVVVPGKRQGKEAEKSSSETPKPLKAKKGGFKKKWNKRKFMKKNGQAVDVEKDETILAGDAHDPDVLMQATVITQEPSSDTLFLQPYEDAKRVELEPPRDIEIVQPSKEPSDAAMLQPEEKARRVEQDSSRDTSMVQPNEEAISVKLEPSIDSTMLQPYKKAGRVELEPARDAAIAQHNNQDRSVKHEPDSDTAMINPDEDARIVKETLRAQPNGEAASIKELKFEDSECLYEHKSQSSDVASPETNKVFGDMTGMDSDPQLI
ncbi:double-stranded RNA-binding protein 7-like isoform X2 [Oryza brachyantha]|uniref:double-stranded RNA-binding protein 7-like isoform X2 n=1 Tax=Oryza brachyantha TaxID=4533 RepID=UPI001ADB579E|nr:double-stranded RNA-binding protein 7-like isoform X2 [Oryza brachyantha]